MDEVVEKKTRRGGKRPGAGRPPGPLGKGRKTSVYLTEPHYVYLKQYGGGKLNAGIKRLIEEKGVDLERFSALMNR